MGDRNARGDCWVEWCIANDQCIMNTWFQNHARRLWTWVSPDGSTKNQVDYVTVNKRFRSSISDCKAYPGADCCSDHNPVIATMKLKSKNTVVKPSPKPDYELLSKDQDLQHLYKVCVQNKYDALTQLEVDEDKSVDKYQSFRSNLVNSVVETIPKIHKKHQKWMTDEILNLMDDSRLAKGKNTQKYKELNQRVKEKCKEAKDNWWNDRYEELERDPATSPTKVKRMIDNSNSCSSSGCIKAKDGTILMTKDKILDRWSEYIEELFQDERSEKPVIRKHGSYTFSILKSKTFFRLYNTKVAQKIRPFVIKKTTWRTYSEHNF